jgi:acyl-CoA oxidase
MNAERAKAAFNIRELTYLLDGGEKATLVKIK